MTVSPTQYKITKTKTHLSCLLENPIRENCLRTIRDVAKVIGHLISILPGVMYGALYYRNLEMDKFAALKLAKGNFEDNMYISHKVISELNLWLCNIDSRFNAIRWPQ